MSEEILEQTAEELEEEQQAVAVSSGEEILDEAKAKVKEDEDGEEEEEMEEAVSVPKTKAGMIKALYNQLNFLKSIKGLMNQKPTTKKKLLKQKKNICPQLPKKLTDISTMLLKSG